MANEAKHQSDDYAEQSAVPRWRAGYLFAYCIFSRETGKSLYIPDDNEAYIRGEEEARNLSELWVMRYNVNGVVYRGSRYACNMENKSPHTRERIWNYFTDSLTTEDFVVVHVVAKLKMPFIQELIRHGSALLMDRSEYNPLMNQLVEELISNFQGSKVNSLSSDYKTINHVIYLEPEASLVEVEALRHFNRHDTEIFIESIRERLGFPKLVYLPVVLQDSILFPGLGCGNRFESCVVIRLFPFDSSEGELEPNRLQISVIPLCYLNHVAICVIKDKYRSQIASFLPSRKSYWDLYRTHSDFERYRTEFMGMQIEYHRLALKVQEFSGKADEILYTHHMYSDTYLEYIPERYFDVESKTAESMKEPLSVVIKRKRKYADNELAAALSGTMMRMQSLNDFLRDAAIADSTSANLKLAKSVKKLTWVVVLVAFLTLIVTVIPDEEKHNFFRLTTRALGSYFHLSLK